MNFLSGSFCSRLNLYVGAGIGVGCLAGQSEAATVVTIFEPGAKTSVSAPGIQVGRQQTFVYNYKYLTASNSSLHFGSDGSIALTRGTDLSASIANSSGLYAIERFPQQGAIWGSNQNYANVSFNGNDGVYEAVVQFYLDGQGGGYLVAMARNDDNAALSISSGKAAIDAAMVPEPSGLALLALGAGGLLARRRRAA